MNDLTEPTPYISLRGVRKSYRRGGTTVPIFENLDLEISRGEFIAIMGPSGSGKSTLLNMLGGIDRNDGGDLTIGNTPLHRMSESALTAWRANNVSIVFQFYNLLPMLSVAENIELPLLLKPIGRKARRNRLETALDLVGLTGRRGHLPAELSGGQQQRVGIARALVSDPALLLCDEPTGDLDRKSADEVMEMLRFLNRDLGKTVVMVTHDPETTTYAKRTLHLNKGHFAERGAAQ